MKHLIAAILIIIPQVAVSQIQYFDSSYTLLSSQTENILNPVFYKGTNPIPVAPDLREHIILYEKGTSNTRNIASGKLTFSGLTEETMLTNDSLFNTNATLAYSKGSQEIRYALAVFETHSQGSIRLRYSYYNGTSWSGSMHIPADTSQCISPSVTNLGQGDRNNFLLAYIKKDAVYVRRFDDGTWGREIRISPDVSNRLYSSPEIHSADYTFFGFAHAAFNYDSAGVKKILYCGITSHSPDSCTVNYSVYFPSDGSKSICSFSQNAILIPVLNFNYETGGSLKSYSATCPGSNFLSIFPQENLPGDNISGSGTAMAILTEQLSQYVAGSWMNIQGDSVWACCKHFYYPVKRYRIGQNVQERNISISPLVRSSENYDCRIWITWNDIENGRYVIRASTGLFFLSQIRSDGLQLSEFTLSQNYPNPFNPSTKISYKLQMPGYISLRIHDVAGREISSLVNTRQSAGSYEIIFPSDNLPSGVYFYSMYIDGVAVASRKMVVLK